MGAGRFITRLMLVTVLTVAAAMITLSLEHRRVVELPRPTGSFPVGRTTVTIRDLRLWIWYPAAASSPPSPYLPAAVREQWEHARPGFINFLTSDLSTVRAHSARDEAISTNESRYPVVLLRSGGSGSALGYSSLGEDLASHGFVVVGLDMTSTSNPELCVGRDDEEACATTVMTPMIEGAGRALDVLQRLSRDDARFRERLDLTRIGMVGHSFGGAQAAQFCSQDSRCTAGVDIDGRPFGSVIRDGIRVPFMFLLSDHGTPSDPVDRQIMGQIQSIYDRQPPDTRVRVVIRGANHFTFTDDGALLKSAVFRGLLRLFGRLHIDGRRQIEVTAYAVRTFFDAHLKRGPGGPIIFNSSAYPELVTSP